MHTHIVLFWLKEGTSEEEQESLRKDCDRLLGAIETVRDIRVGLPANTYRDIVERGYDLAIVVTFDDLEGHDIYQDHPIHEEFIKAHVEHWEKVQVVDIANWMRCDTP